MSTVAHSSAALSVCLLASIGWAQSDPADFGTVYNIGVVPAGSPFDITSDDIAGTVVTGTQVGDGGGFVNEAFVTPTFLGGDTLAPGSQLNLFDGGEILPFFSVGPASDPDSKLEVNINGGTVGLRFDAQSGSTVNLSGGTVGSFVARSGSTINIFGGLFEVDGVATSDISEGFAFGSSGLLTGVLADGSVFIFAGEGGDQFALDSTTLRTVDVVPSANPGVLSSGTFTKGVRAGETLTVSGTGALGDNFAVVGGTLTIEGGSTGTGVEVISGEVDISGAKIGDLFNAYSGSTVNISGGAVGSGFDAYSGSTINISGGDVGDFFTAERGSTVNISGGAVGSDFRARFQSTVNISGGVVDDAFTAESNSTVNISGGIVGESFTANFGSMVNLFGTSFFLDGVELTGLVLGEALTITDRDVMLTGILEDGSAFGFNLDSSFVFGEEFFSPGATLTVTLVPAPGAMGVLALAGLAAARRRR